MNDPTPESLDSAAAVRVYLAANLVGASTGLLSPRIAVAGVEETDAGVTLHFGVDAPVGDDYPRFEELTGGMLTVRVDVGEWVLGARYEGVDWTYQRWIDDMELDQ